MDEMKLPPSNAIIMAVSYALIHPFSPGKRTMTNHDPNADRYITIARACLKAINDTAADAGSREEKIQAVYQAIDKAFQAEFADYRQAIAVMGSVLERIASGQLDGQAAASLARKTLDQQPRATRNDQIH
jgi:hypothetical protein